MSCLLNVFANVLRTSPYRLVHRCLWMEAALKQSLPPKLKTGLTQGCVQTQTTAATRCYCSAAYNISTNITNDVVLFKYENPRYFNMLNFFAICQLMFWTYLSHFAFTSLKDAPVEENPKKEIAWYQRINLGDNKYRNAISVSCFIIGYGIFVAAWFFTLRSVRFLILRKGGKDISFVTYGPFNKNRIMTVPLKFVSAQESREAARVQLPLKVKNRIFYYVLDMRGEFRNQKLFDYTAGLKRRID